MEEYTSSTALFSDTSQKGRQAWRRMSFRGSLATAYMRWSRTECLSTSVLQKTMQERNSSAIGCMRQPCPSHNLILSRERVETAMTEQDDFSQRVIRSIRESIAA